MRSFRSSSVPVLLIALVFVLSVAAAAGAQPPPANRSYEFSFVVPAFGDEPEEPGSDCLTFTETEVCIAGLGECRPWTSHMVIDEKRPAFKSIFRYTDEEGTLVELHLRGFAERRGVPGSSIGGVAVVAASEADERVVVNFGFTGRSVEDCSGFDDSSQ